LRGSSEYIGVFEEFEEKYVRDKESLKNWP
jgi:hypothetical protein